MKEAMWWVMAALFLIMAVALGMDAFRNWQRQDNPPATCVCSCDDDSAELTVEPLE